jgi:hypothetical protein
MPGMPWANWLVPGLNNFRLNAYLPGESPKARRAVRARVGGAASDELEVAPHPALKRRPFSPVGCRSAPQRVSASCSGWSSPTRSMRMNGGAMPLPHHGPRFVPSKPRPYRMRRVSLRPLAAASAHALAHKAAPEPAVPGVRGPSRSPAVQGSRPSVRRSTSDCDGDTPNHAAPNRPFLTTRSWPAAGGHERRLRGSAM